MTRLLLLGLLASCTIADTDSTNCTDGKCDGTNVDQSCSDPKYGDGTCQMQLDCAVPDIDCFETFDTDANAAAWYSTQEASIAAGMGKPPRTIVAESDPRFKRARDLLDRGWDAFRKHRPVGKLADKRPGLVVLEDTTINAYVIADAQKDLSAFSVQVLTGALVPDASDDQLLGLMMHELQHAVGLHLIKDGLERQRKYYIAQGREPIGAAVPEDARARMSGDAWRKLASDVGGFDAEGLAGLPIAGDLDQVFMSVVSSGVMKDQAACAPSVQAANELRSYVMHTDPIDVHLTADLADVPARAADALAALRDQCLADFPYSFVDVIAKIKGTTADDVRQNMDPSDLALVDGVHVVDAIAALEADRRARMRMIEQAFTDQTSQPWTALRYHSAEEDADDTSVAVLRAAGLDPAGIGGFLESALPEDGPARCEALLGAGMVPPYGVDLSDEHHATCWRIYHVRTLAADKTGARFVPPPAHEPSRRALPLPAKPPIAY